MQPRIEILLEKKLIGKSLKMSLANNKTAELWSSFMLGRKRIKNTLGSEFFSMQIYDKSLDFKNFNPQTEFTKCAMIETSKFEDIPEDMETRILVVDCTPFLYIKEWRRISQKQLNIFLVNGCQIPIMNWTKESILNF